MKRQSSFGCLVWLAIAAVLAIVAFIAGTSLVARAETALGPPADTLSGVQAGHLGIQLGWHTGKPKRCCGRWPPTPARKISALP